MTNSIVFDQQTTGKRKNSPVHSDLQQVKKLSTLAQVDVAPLLRVRTVFPLRFFPCTITLDRTRITVKNQTFFFSQQVQNLLLTNVMAVAVEEAGPFATFVIQDILPVTEDIRVGPLWRSDAHALRKMVDALLIALKQNIDVSQVTNNDLMSQLQTAERRL